MTSRTNGVTLSAALLGATVVGLSIWFGNGLGGLLYLILYVLATMPGWPVGFALFGRRHAAGWIAGALIGYAITAVTLWTVIKLGIPGALTFLGAWLIVAAAIRRVFNRRRRNPLVALPSWGRRDTLALIFTLSLVPLLVAPTFRNVGRADEGGRQQYRAYFTADVLWHAALTNELARFDMPPRDPYAGDQTLNYYWSHFLLPASALGTNPFGLWPDPLPLLKVNAMMSGLLFVGAIAMFVWTLVPRAWPMFWAVSLSVVAASLEGAYALYDLYERGRPLDGVRALNIDAITSWFFRSLTIDDLPRSLWYTPQHAMACSLGTVALIVAGRSRDGLRWPAALGAGALLGGAVMMSPFLGGVFAVIYGLTAAWAFRGGMRGWVVRVATHAVAMGPVIAAIGWCAFNHNFDGAGGAVHIGYTGPILKAPWLTPALALGPLLVAAALGIIARRFTPNVRLTPAIVAVISGFGLFYFVTLPGGDLVWVGWRAGQILLIGLPALAAIWFAWAFETRGRLAAGALTIVLLFAAGLPTTVIDAYNAQDITNRDVSPGGFRWTVVVRPPQLRAAAWIRKSTPADAIVQMSPIPRARETWTFIPTFAARRMAAGLPISLLRKPLYDERSARVEQMYSSATAQDAWTIARDLHIGYVYLDEAERSAYKDKLTKFDDRPDLFKLLIQDEDVRVYEVQKLSP
ncbi:MAG: hypothetical protein EPO35_02215 [Acidobacteria bacterium]|nr:MAG: hypothetical protein EPO35_02215 [Acidobacteriota bacterium]